MQNRIELCVDRVVQNWTELCVDRVVQHRIELYRQGSAEQD